MEAAIRAGTRAQTMCWRGLGELAQAQKQEKRKEEKNGDESSSQARSSIRGCSATLTTAQLTPEKGRGAGKMTENWRMCEMAGSVGTVELNGRTGDGNIW